MELHPNELIAALAHEIGAVLQPLVPRRSKCALLDFPNHGNVGDNAIWLGERAFLRSIDAAVVYTADIATYSKAKLVKRLGGGVLFLHGGGNLGDVWPYHQRFREEIIAEFPDAQIIQLPQTIHFKEKANLERARSIFNSHPDLTLLVRDARSLELARNEFRARSYLCPDMAFMLRGLARPAPPKDKIVWLSRTDTESSGPWDFPPEPDVYRADWRRDPPSLIFRANHFLTRRSKTPVLGGFARSLSRGYDALAKYRLFLGCRILSRGRVVVTDRLHGHILSLLLGIPNVLLDNNYGKVKSFYETWTKNCGLTVWADSLQEAFDTGRSLAEPLNAA